MTQLPAVDVLVDDSGRLGRLAYLVPAGVTLGPGDAVTVPFGKAIRHGVVLGPAGSPEKATKEVSARLGSRSDPRDLVVAQEIAEQATSTLEAVTKRLSPKTGRGTEPLDAGPVVLTERDREAALPVPPKNWQNRLYLRAPGVSPARLAAREAERLAAASGGQVLVLCPTVALLELVTGEFVSGAARLDSKARAGAWRGFREGTVRVGVGTRAAALYSADALGGIVVVEEEHPGHVESTTPYTNARDVAVRRAAAHRCALTLISACPSAQGLGSRVKVLPVGGRSDWPAPLVVDRTTSPPGRRLVPGKLQQVLDRADREHLPVAVIAQKQPAVRVCASCSDPRPCRACSLSGCVHVEAAGCSRCGSTGIRWVGWDVTRLKQLLPAASPVLLADLFTWADAQPTTEATARAASPRGRVPAGRSVVLFDFDALLSSAVLEPQHAVGAVLLRASEAAGPGGQVVVVTSHPDDPVLQAWLRRDHVGLARLVWEHARAQGLPPFGRVVTVRMDWEKPPRVDGWPGTVLGPRRRAGEWEVLVLTDDAGLSAFGETLRRLRRRGRMRIWVR